MKKAKLNLIIDAFMFLLMMAIAGIGFLMKRVLVPGFLRNEQFEKGVELYYWGMDRHEWGAIHLKLSFVLLVLLVLHLVLHWKQVVSIFQRMLPVKPIRVPIAVAMLLASSLLFLFPFFVDPDIKPLQTKAMHQSQRSLQPKEKQKAEPTPVVHEVAHMDEIHGSMTLQQVADKYHLSATHLANQLNVPENKLDERLGRLKRQYGFSMDEVRKIIEQ